MRPALALVLLVACGRSPTRSSNFQEAISVVAACSNTAYGWILELEEGVSDTSCLDFNLTLADEQALCLYLEDSGVTGFNGLATVDTSGWTVRVRAEPVQEAGYVLTGQTFWEQKTIDIYQGKPLVFIHELNHVALGPSSANHLPKEGADGWCNFALWERVEFGLDEMAYLGCP